MNQVACQEIRSITIGTHVCVVEDRPFPARAPYVDVALPVTDGTNHANPDVPLRSERRPNAVHIVNKRQVSGLFVFSLISVPRTGLLTHSIRIPCP